MGKSRQRDRKKARTDPIAKPVKPPADPELAAIREKQILPIIADLVNPESKKRSAAAIAIANIIEDTKCRKLLLREQIVRILLEQTITDSALESKSAGWGILRNLALEEQADFSIHLYRQDILTAIQAVAQNIIDSFRSKDQFIKLPKAQQNLIWTLNGSVLGLISSLAEAQDEILEAITKIPTIINYIFGLIHFELFPEDLFVNALHCLAILTEDNQPMTKQIINHGSWLKGLLQLREAADSKAVAACGVVHNIFSSMQWFDHNTPIEGMSDAILIPTLMHYVETFQTKQEPSNQPQQSGPDQILQLALEITASIATSLQEALEHASHDEKEFIGFDDDDIEVQDEAMMEDGKSDIDDGKEGANDNREMIDEEIDADMRLVAGADMEEDHRSTAVQPTLAALIRIATPVILSITQNSHLDNAIMASALSALNNISWTVSCVNFGEDQSNLSGNWAGFAQHIWSEIVCPVLASNTADIELASCITSIAWAITRGASDKIEMAGEEHKKFIALYQASRSLPPAMNNHQNGSRARTDTEDFDAFQGLGVKCIGVLGRLSMHPTNIEINRDVGRFLVAILSALPETPAADAVEALNQLFDIYADKEYDYDGAVFWGEGFYHHLEAVLPKARKMAKSIDKRKYTELRLRADEAVLNLGRFLIYKRKEATPS